MRKLLFTVLAFFAVGVSVLPAQQITRRFTLDDFSKVARVSDPQFAPDGKSIAVVVSRPNLDENRYDPELTVVDVATKTSHGRGCYRSANPRAHVQHEPRADDREHDANRRFNDDIPAMRDEPRRQEMPIEPSLVGQYGGDHECDASCRDDELNSSCRSRPAGYMLR